MQPSICNGFCRGNCTRLLDFITWSYRFSGYSIECIPFLFAKRLECEEDLDLYHEESFRSPAIYL